jgi:hypothetical protein
MGNELCSERMAHRTQEWYYSKEKTNSATGEGLDQVNYGVIGVPPSRAAPLTRMAKGTDSSRPKGVGATLWAGGSVLKNGRCMSGR